MTAYHTQDFPDAAAINPGIVATVLGRLETGELRCSHAFRGRFENLYLPLALIPELGKVLAFTTAVASDVLGISAVTLRVGFWFNLMRPGDSTTPHTHDEDDELLSGVYYLTVPPDSGELILYPNGAPVHITPHAGQLILFRSDLLHEVGENRSTRLRLSVGMNFGPA